MKNVIEEIMNSKQLSLHQIGKLIDYDVAVVSRVKNRVQKMSMRMAVKISTTFDIPLDYIINVEEIK